MALTQRERSWSIHALLPFTRANGPGVRFGIWVQGCNLGCRGCFNPETHVERDPEVTVGDVLSRFLASGLSGVTISGGEPLQQPEALGEFVSGVRAAKDASIIVLTGYTFTEIHANPKMLDAVSLVDTVVCGRFNKDRVLGSGLRGSDNKGYWHISGNLTDADFSVIPELEAHIGTDGSITWTGMEDRRSVGAPL